MTSIILNVILLLTSTSAFVQHRQPTRLHPLHATETFQRSLLEARLNPSAKKAPADVATPSVERGPSVDYDATVRLAYQASESSGDFEAYKMNYLEETSALMAKKNPYVTSAAAPAQVAEPAKAAAVEAKPVERGPSVDYEAAARLAYEAAGKPGDFDAFNRKYLDETSAMIAKKNPYVTMEQPEAKAAPVEVQAAEPAPVIAEEPKPAPVVPPPVPTPPPAPLPKTSFTIPRELSLVPINEASVQFTAGLLGASAGFLLGGPILAAILAATTNYLSRKDDESNNQEPSPKKIVDTASQTALLVYNFLARFEKENKVVDTTFKVLEGAIDKVKATEGGSALLSVESTLGGISKKVEEFNDDYDVVKGAETVLNSVGDLVEISVDKVRDLNEEYKLTERVGSVLKGTVDKLTDDK
jgi:hypothetical protein